MATVFTEEQNRAVHHKDHPMIVVAGPGSGKTTVLTHRVKTLITEHKVKSDDILVITFTKAAAVEMQGRFNRLMGEKTNVTFGTFHSVFFRILRQVYGYSVDNIIRDEIKRQILLDAVAYSRMEPEDSSDFYSQIAGEISRVKSDGLDIGVYNSARYPAEEFRKVYQYYEKALRRNRLLDFDDMLLQCRELLTTHPEVLARWQKRYSYILIDEFQDINKMQYDVIRMLALPENNLFVVGDDDQSIYGFRGSRPEIMLRFEEDYKDALKVVLDANFRSTANIVTAAGKVILHNKVRFQKDIHTTNETGEPVDIVEFPAANEEYERIIGEISRQTIHSDYSRYAILYRTNATAEPLVRALIMKNIPFTLKEGMPNIFDHWIAKDMIAYMTLAIGGRERADFLRIANKPLRYIGRDYLTDPEVDFDELEKYYEEKYWMVERIRKLESDLNMMGRMAPFAAINFLRRGIGYDDYLKAYAQEHSIDVTELYDTAQELMQTTKDLRTIAEWFSYIGDYSRQLREQNLHRTNEQENAVTLTTMHSSKGLEFDEVFVIDVNEGICPHKKSVFPDQIEEERRMFYVAMTRAKEKLHIYYTKNRYNRKLEPSRFISEIMSDGKAKS